MGNDKKYYSPEWLIEQGLTWNGKTFPYNPKLKSRASSLRKQMTKAEKKLWYDFLSKHTVKFLRQKIIGHYIVDFYCSKLRLAIEVDGSYHYEQNAIVYDEARTEYLNCFDVEVVRFSNNEVINNFKYVINKINSYFE